MKISESLVRSLGRAVSVALRSTLRKERARQRPVRPSTGSRKPAATPDYPGDFEGYPRMEYAPHSTPLPDPGEIAWGWVPYEEDYTQGKDRPVLIIGRDAGWLLGLPLSSVDHEQDARQEASQGRFWVDVGSGEWDNKGRESSVRVDRIVRINPTGMRRVAGELDVERFKEVADGVAQYWDK